jgi:hypothetical protein
VLLSRRSGVSSRSSSSVSSRRSGGVSGRRSRGFFLLLASSEAQGHDASSGDGQNAKFHMGASPGVNSPTPCFYTSSCDLEIVIIGLSEKISHAFPAPIYRIETNR